MPHGDPFPDNDSPGHEAPFDPSDCDEPPGFDATASNDLANQFRVACLDMTALRRVLGTLAAEEERVVRRVLARVEEARVSRLLTTSRMPWGQR